MKLLKTKIINKFVYKLIIVFAISFGALGITLHPNHNTIISTNNIVLAQSESETTTATTDDDKVGKAVYNDISDKIYYLDLILKIFYLILRPLIAIAGISLDNTLVYGSILNLDVPLWQIWNIMKNFANFTLGFIVLYEIIKSFFDKEGPGAIIGVIKKALIAGIAIQASRFLLGAIVDLSTVATYSLGAMPMSVITDTNKQEDLGNMVVLSSHTKLDRDGKKDGVTGSKINTYFSFNGYNLSYCRLKQLDDSGKEYVVGRTIGSLDFNAGFEENNKEICVYSSFPGKVIVFDSLVEDLKSTDTNDWYNTMLLWAIDDQISFLKGDKDTEIDGEAHPIDYYLNGNNQEGDKWLQDQLAEEANDKKDTNTIKDIIDTSKGFTTVMGTLFSSIIDFANISNINSHQVLPLGEYDTQDDPQGLGYIRLDLIIKMLFALALIIPLIIMTAVLIGRIGYLWLIIAFIPMIIIKRVFANDNSSLEDIPSFEKVLSIIFAPVIIVFTMSLSLVFMTSLSAAMHSTTGSEKVLKSMDIRPDKKGMDVLDGLLKIEIGSSTFNDGLSFISRLITQLFAVAIVRMMLFAALKANDLGKQIIDKTGADKRGKGLLNATPIPGMNIDGHAMTIGALGGGFSQFTQNFSRNVVDQEEVQMIVDKFSGKKGKKGESNTNADS